MTIYLSTLNRGIGRAEAGAGGAWSVEVVAADLDVRTLAVDPHRPATVLAGTQGRGVWVSSDAGRSFSPFGLEGVSVKSIAFHPVRPGRIFAGTKPAAIHRSDDGGRSWLELDGFKRVRRFFWFSPAEPRYTAYVQAIALTAMHPEVVVAGIEAGAVVRSVDGGASWEGHRPGSMRDCHSLAAGTDGTFFEGGYGGGAMSTDGGRTWSRPGGLDRRYGWAVAAGQGGDWYLSSSPGVQAHSERADAAIWRAAPGGRWQRLRGGLPDPLDRMPYALIPGPEPGRLVAGLADGELWETRDRGDSWAPLGLKLAGIERTLVRLG